MDRRNSPRPQRVLIVDDSSDIRELWRAWLSFWGFDVEQAANGFEAVQKAERHPPDLVLMDLWMPVLDGFAATTRLKENPATAGIPVLALSADVFSPTPERARAVGCDSFLPKPVGADDLIDAIRSTLRRMAEQGGPLPTDPRS